jgi:two-component system, LytTR family, response regulator
MDKLLVRAWKLNYQFIMINAILVDDELHCLKSLKILLEEHCPQVKVVDECRSASNALTSIKMKSPDLVFLDIEMPIMNGFEMLEQFSKIPFSVIFTTSYDQYAIKAIRYSALDYLLKPIDPKELVLSVQKVVTKRDLPFIEQFEMLFKQINQKGKGFEKIAVPTIEGFDLVHTDQIIRCESDSNYTHVYLRDRKIVACRTLKEMEELLHDFQYFVRVHHSYIVNMNEVSKYVRGDGGYLLMSDGSNISISRSRRESLIKWFV